MEGKIAEYKILRHNMTDTGDFGSQVSAFLNEGFELHGSPLMSSDGKIFAQAIVRWRDKAAAKESSGAPAHS